MRKLFLLSALCVLTLTLVGCKDKNDDLGNGGKAKVDCVLPDNVEAVDLGLPSGIKWANMNVGATRPEEYGAYFAWGETSPKEVYNWSTYFDTNDDGSTFTKYDSERGKITLVSEDDAAYVNWGGDWCMPTYAEWSELKNTDNCTWEWKENYNGTKVNGYLVTSKRNRNYIFLPASGGRYDSSLNDVESGGYYWSASLLEIDSNSAYNLRFNSNRASWNVLYRNTGLSVRPVCK